MRLPANESGSAIKPGKVKPAQVEALPLVCTPVMGHDMAIGSAASQVQFALNTFKPRIASRLRDAALALGSLSAADFDAWVRPAAMLGPSG